MQIKITNKCTNCGLCKPVCPENAIYEAGEKWLIMEGIFKSEAIVLQNGKTVIAGTPQPPLSKKIFYVVPDKCTGCEGTHDQPQCVSVCPENCCVPDDHNPNGELSRLADRMINFISNEIMKLDL